MLDFSVLPFICVSVAHYSNDMVAVPRRDRSALRWSRLGLHSGMLFLVWLLLSGHYDAFHLALGVLSVGLVVLLNRRDYIRDNASSHERNGLHLLQWVGYIAWLSMEMILSAAFVVRCVLSPRMPIQPQLIQFESEQPNDLAKVILGNSITLTPGTLTVDIDGNRFLVHALSDPTAEGLIDGQMQTKVARLFVGNPGRMVFDVRRDQGKLASRRYYG